MIGAGKQLKSEGEETKLLGHDEILGMETVQNSGFLGVQNFCRILSRP